jgi:glycosyltransferase involved in cell wall biosynthesis
MQKISVAIIAKNEGNSIGRCLESVKDADEIIVCDTGSDEGDKTTEIAKSYGAKVFTDYKWIKDTPTDSFANARNHARNKCTGDWILTIDCDNRLAPSMVRLREVVAEADRLGKKTVSIKIYLENGMRYSHDLPYLYKNDPLVFWKGDCHNHLTWDDKYDSDLQLICWHSDSHEKDPDRSFRILKRYVLEHPECIREKFYLAREYFNRGRYIEALWFYQKYIKVSTYMAEGADAYLMMARCYWALQEGEVARAMCMEALRYNANFREAILFMANMSGPKNKDRWLLFAETANNEDVLFMREPKEWEAKDYDNQYTNDVNMTRYQAIQEEIGKIVGDHSVIDVGCGVGELSKYIKNYKGFDFSEVGIKVAKEKGADVWVGDAYDKENYKPTDYYVITEVLEHLNDLKVLDNIPKGSNIIFSVPSFADPSHIRVFTEKIVQSRYSFLNIKNIIRFNWQDKWIKGGEETPSYILLIEATN